MAVNMRWLSRLRKREKILILAAVVFAALYVLLSFLVMPAIRRHRLNGTLIEEKETILAGYLETLEKEKVLKRKLLILEEASKIYDQYLLESAKPALAAAELQNRVKEAAASHGLNITSEKIAKPDQKGNYVDISVEITAKGDIEPIKDFLYNIESGRPILTVSSLTLRTGKRRVFDASTRKYKDVEELQTTILISEMMKREL